MKLKVVTKLADYLNSRGIKQSWLAKEIGAEKTQVSNWCKNDKKTGYAKSTPSIGYVILILDVLNCNINDLWEVKGE